MAILRDTYAGQLTCLCGEPAGYSCDHPKCKRVMCARCVMPTGGREFCSDHVYEDESE